METKYNLVIVLHAKDDKVLMCYRSKDPYKGKYNFIGGKVDQGESYLESSYRELFEETGISKKDIILRPFIDYRWHPANMEMKVFIGKLYKEIKLVEEVHQLHWIDMTENFYDESRFAGEGNIGHMINIYKLHKDYTM